MASTTNAGGALLAAVEAKIAHALPEMHSAVENVLFFQGGALEASIEPIMAAAAASKTK
jgi:hypothetical protein